MPQIHDEPVTSLSDHRKPGDHDADTAASKSSSNATARRLLQIYLADHEAASRAGVNLVHRVRSENEAAAYGDYLVKLEAEVEQDRASLINIMKALQVSANPVKQLVARAAVIVGRLKPNGQLHGYSPLSRVLELEALCAAALAKRGLWQSLRVLAPIYPELEVATLDRLIDRATEQFENLTDQHRQAAREAFGG